MTNLTTRSKITIRWTTNPADLGYDGRKSNWLDAPGEVMSMRKALNFAYELEKRVGSGVYKKISYQNRGNEVSINDIREVLDAAEYSRS